MTELIVALDFPEASPAMDLAKRLAHRVHWFKVGLELFTAAGPDIVSALKGMGASVFLDLKLMDIPNTVRGAVASATRAGADMLTVHALGGIDMLRAAIDGADAARGTRPLLLGVTLLTSLTATDLPWCNVASDEELVLRLARSCADSGLNGVVCSGREIAAVRRIVPPSFLCVVPGIRSQADAHRNAPDDQKRTVTPAEAALAGAGFIVVGRPVTAATDPALAAQAILADLQP